MNELINNKTAYNDLVQLFNSMDYEIKTKDCSKISLHITLDGIYFSYVTETDTVVS